MNESRVKKSLLNAKVNLIFYFVTLFISFFSRKIFLDYLGTDFLGLTGTIGNLLSFLNLAELGIGSIIGFVLYKPIYNKDKKQICEIISVFGYLYRIVGCIILTGGIILSCFIPLIFKDCPISLFTIYLLFFSSLIGTLWGYFFNYKYTLLGADQKSYLVTSYFQSGNALKTVLQMTSAYYTQSYSLWIVIELAFGIAYCFIINWKISKEYPWLKTSYQQGKALYKNYPIIMQKSKQMFVHTLAKVARFQIIPFLLYPFASLSTVAYYGNYVLITSKMGGLINSLLNSTGAGVGNLIAEGDKDKIIRVYWELNAIRYFFIGLITFGLYQLTGPFIHIWLGEKYVLPQTILIIILCDSFISLVRGTNDQFINGYGLFQDIWAPFAEIILVVVCSIVGGYLWGFSGVLLGSIPGDILIVSLWKPFMLYHKGFKFSFTDYWWNIGKLLLSFSLSFLVCHYISTWIAIDVQASYLHWTVKALLNILSFAIVYSILLFCSSQGFRDFYNRIREKVKNKNSQF